jgi:hypothetical protein
VNENDINSAPENSTSAKHPANEISVIEPSPKFLPGWKLKENSRRDQVMAAGLQLR